MGSPTTNGHPAPADFAAWRERLASLTAEVRRWAESEKWPVSAEEKAIEEPGLPPYAATLLHIQTPQGRVDLEPIAFRVLGTGGRVELAAWPSLNRVSLQAKNGSWVVWTDSNIPWPKPWGRDTFIELARELAASE